MSKPACHPVIVLAVTLATAVPVTAQEAKPADRPRQPAQPVAPSHRDAGTTTPANPQALRTAIPGLEDADSKILPAPLRAEGTFLTEQRGSMVRVPTGEWVFVFHRDAKGRRERPMVLAPCQNLQRMEQLVAERGPGTVLTLTGQVLTYLNVNYLLPTRYSIVPASAAPDGDTPGSPAAGEPATPSPENSGDQGVQALIRDLESQRDPVRAADPARSIAERPPAAPANPAGATDSAGLLPEGTAVVRRRGRLMRAGDGMWAVTFDNGVSGATPDRPLAVVPCMNLALMERWATLRGEAVTFEVSGRVLACNGRNYLLPSMFQVYPPNDLEPRQ